MIIIVTENVSSKLNDFANQNNKFENIKKQLTNKNKKCQIKK